MAQGFWGQTEENHGRVLAPVLQELRLPRTFGLAVRALAITSTTVAVLVLGRVEARLVVGRVRHDNALLEEPQRVLQRHLRAQRRDGDLRLVQIHAEAVEDLGHHALVPPREVGHVAARRVHVRSWRCVAVHTTDCQIDEPGPVLTGSASEALELAEPLHVRDGVLTHLREAVLEVPRRLGLRVVVGLNADEVVEVCAPVACARLTALWATAVEPVRTEALGAKTMVSPAAAPRGGGSRCWRRSVGCPASAALS